MNPAVAVSPSRSRLPEWWLTLPSLLWLGAFFAIPLVLIVVLSFKTADLRGGLGPGWSLDAVRNLTEAPYPELAWRTFRVSALSTVYCLCLALPVAWCLARATPRIGQLLLLLIVVPFFTNFLIRVFAWKSLLHPEGPLSAWLRNWHLIGADTQLLNNSGSVMLVMVYTNLPFAIFPLYAATQKFDFTLLEAARDLGASPTRAFFRIFLPGIRQGLLSAAFMVFVCTMGQYVVPQVIGGTGDEMLGAKIAQRALNDRNLPQACALAAALMLAGLLPWLVAKLWQLSRRPRISTVSTVAPSTPANVYPA
ncbi:MAG: ABC transporter permease [Verrucomicrobiota bacterium]